MSGTCRSAQRNRTSDTAGLHLDGGAASCLCFDFYLRLVALVVLISSSL